MQDALDSALDSFIPTEYTARARTMSPDQLGNVHPKLQELDKKLARFRNFFDPPDPASPAAYIPMNWCSPKVQILAQELFDRYTPTFQGIIFVEQRHVATCLVTILSRIQLISHIIKPEQLVGHGKETAAKSHAKGMGTRNQQDTVKMFRERQINVCECVPYLCFWDTPF